MQISLVPAVRHRLGEILSTYLTGHGQHCPIGKDAGCEFNVQPFRSCHHLKRCFRLHDVNDRNNFTLFCVEEASVDALDSINNDLSDHDRRSEQCAARADTASILHL